MLLCRMRQLEATVHPPGLSSVVVAIDPTLDQLAAMDALFALAEHQDHTRLVGLPVQDLGAEAMPLISQLPPRRYYHLVANALARIADAPAGRAGADPAAARAAAAPADMADVPLPPVMRSDRPDVVRAMLEGVAFQGVLVRASAVPWDALVAPAGRGIEPRGHPAYARPQVAMTRVSPAEQRSWALQWYAADGTVHALLRRSHLRLMQAQRLLMAGQYDAVPSLMQDALAQDPAVVAGHLRMMRADEVALWPPAVMTDFLVATDQRVREAAAELLGRFPDTLTATADVAEAHAAPAPDRQPPAQRQGRGR